MTGSPWPRLSRMVKHPVVAAVTYIVWNFSMRPQARP